MAAKEWMDCKLCHQGMSRELTDNFMRDVFDAHEEWLEASDRMTENSAAAKGLSAARFVILRMHGICGVHCMTRAVWMATLAAAANGRRQNGEAQAANANGSR